MSKQVKNLEFKKNLGIQFKDVAGMEQVKLEMMEYVDFLKNPKQFQRLGAQMPKGALLSGPPGTGKTHLAKALAGEAGVPFFYMSGSEFVEKYVGVGAQRVRRLFKEARKHQPAIIFIDEIDAIAKKREGFMNEETTNTLNQLLVEMDGFADSSQVVVIGSTNLPDNLDPALLRPGRLDRLIEVTLPTLLEREMIFDIYLQRIKTDTSKKISYYSKRLATLTPSFSGSDIRNVVNEAAIISVRNGRETVNDKDFEEAIERVIGGIERKSQTFEEQKEVVAIHESGHGVVSWMLKGGNPLVKISIKPRSKGALGFAQYLPPESSLYSKQDLLDQIACILAGRCAEVHFLKKSSTGAHDDFQKAKRIAFQMVTTFGMSEEMNFVPFQLDQDGNKTYSNKTYEKIDNAVSSIIQQQTKRCFQIIQENEQSIKNLTEKLLQKNVLIFPEIQQILGKRPFEPSENFKRFLKEIENSSQI